MRPILTIAWKDLRLLKRDSRSAVILFIMPVILILVLGLSLGEGFGQKPDDRIRISIVNDDTGLEKYGDFPPKAWSQILLDDLADTADIRVEIIPSRDEAERLVRTGRRSCIIVLEPQFSDYVQRCSFVGEPFKLNPINPLYRDGMKTRDLGVTFLRDPTQQVSSAVIEQVMQVTLMRVVIPWMIGQAFEQIGSDEFMTRMEKHIPAMRLAYAVIPRKDLGNGMQKGISAFFSNYKFTAKTWAGLTNSTPSPKRSENLGAYQSDGSGVIKRGAARYQILVPGYTVSFAFFLVLTVGWLFVAERRHGTLVRLRAAPLFRFQILLGKLLPCLAISLFQGLFLLLAGKLVFGMNWGPMPWLLILVVLCTSFAAVGLSMLVAAMAKTETQVAVYGTLLVLVMAGVSGSMMPRDMMPEEMREFSRVTPHAWALDAYAQLLANPEPQVAIVTNACLALLGFATLFLLIAWWRMSLE